MTSDLGRDEAPLFLVTGANGFVGSATCETLRASRYRLRSASRSRGAGTGESRVVGEIGPDTDWSAALEGVGCVVHLAARVHVMDEGAEDPLEEFRRVNVAGTERLAREAAAAGVRRLVYVSSIKVNGEKTRSAPFDERDAPAPEDPYAISKWEAEQRLFEVSAETGLEVTVLRPPLVYGPGVRANFLQFLKVADSGLPLPLGSVDNRRSFVYVANLADAIRACVEDSRAAGEVFVVDDGNAVSTPYLIRRAALSLGRETRLPPCPPSLLRLAGRVTGRSQTVARLLDSLEVDASKIKERLSWEPPYTLEEGLGETARWYRGG